MRIEYIKLKNFRLYQHAKIEFPNIKDNDIHIVIGDNGKGKTTLLNSINWCLYGEEPHLLSEADGLPIINTKILNEKEDNEVSVEIKVSVTNEENYIYTRKMKYDPFDDKTTLEIYKEKNNGESELIAPKHNTMYVNKFVNEMIREFYFFDGEKLNDYFKRDNIGRIKQNVLEVSNIKKLIQMEDHLNNKIKEYDKQTKRKGSNLKDLVETKETIEKNRDQAKQKRETLEKELIDFQNEKEKIDLELRGAPNINEIKSEIEKFKKRLEDKEKLINEKNKERNETNFDYAPPIFLYKAIKSIINEIEFKENENQLPPPIDKNVIEKSISTCHCELCQNELNNDKINYLKHIIKEYDLSNNDTKLLRDLETPLKINFKKTSEYYEKSKKNIHEYNTLLKEYHEIDKDINDLKGKIIGSDNEEIAIKFKKQDELDDDIENHNRELGKIENEIERYDKEFKNIETKLIAAMKKEKKTKILSKKRQLCVDSLNVVEKTKNEIMEKTKDNIEKYTNKTFLELIWKKETYDHISIDDKYNLSLSDTYGFQALGTASGAERRLLALSYTLGIHSVSGYNSPLIIDTPLSNVSDENKKNFSKSLIKVSENKQIILLFTKDEYSENIREYYEGFLHYLLKNSEDEKSTDIMLLGDSYGKR